MTSMKSPDDGRCGRTYGGPRRGLALLAIAVGVIVAAQSGAAAVKVRSDFDERFDFTTAKTWAWTTPKIGYVVAARTSSDDPDAIQKRAEPIIVEAVTAEMPARGLTSATGTPDLNLTYYLLLTVNTSAQIVGQFLPSTVQWGIPPFAPTTQSLKVFPQGSLVLDVSSKGQPVWRGAAEAEIKWEYSEEKRVALLREAVKEILKNYPPKKK
jgi:uncharacterized protein DUF4136